MSKKATRQNVKVWLEISKSAVQHNFEIIKNLLNPHTELWAVVKSNAYGHGIFAFTKIANEIGVDGFCVDSVIEGVKLRAQGIIKPILVLGATLPSLYAQAAQNKITLSISSWPSLEALTEEIGNPNDRPEIHLKIDTGMHRQGFFINDFKKVLRYCKKNNIKVRGIFSHFASAKDVNYPTYSEHQFELFQQAIALSEAEGFTNIKRHIAATGGTLINQKYHLDLVRIGIGLYGIFPSKELAAQLGGIAFKPALSWHSIVSETKKIPKGAYVGYDLTEHVTRKTLLAIVPIGYWHGFPWNLSNIGTVLVNGTRAKVLGRVSMDMIAVDATNAHADVGDMVTIIGKQGSEEITAREVAETAKTSPYEIITRINPLIEHVVVE